MPPITLQILREMYRLHKRGEQPLLILYLGFSIEVFAREIHCVYKHSALRGDL